MWASEVIYIYLMEYILISFFILKCFIINLSVSECGTLTVCDIIALPYCVTCIAYFKGRELFVQFKLIGRSAHAQKLHPLFNGPHPS